jgi:hypothetical protein
MSTRLMGDMLFHVGKTLIILVLFRIIKMMISLSEGLGQFFKILMLYDVKVKNFLGKDWN